MSLKQRFPSVYPLVSVRVTPRCGGSSARALVLHTQRSGPRDRHEERCCGSRLHPIRGQLLLGHLTVSTTQVSLLDPSTACQPPLMTLELLAVLLPMFLTNLACALVPALAGCLELTCVLSKCAQDHWQLEIRAVTGGVDGPLRRQRVHHPQDGRRILRRGTTVDTSSFHPPGTVCARQLLASMTACAHAALPAPSAHASLTVSRSLVSSLWSRIARAYESRRASR